MLAGMGAAVLEGAPKPKPEGIEGIDPKTLVV